MPMDAYNMFFAHCDPKSLEQLDYYDHETIVDESGNLLTPNQTAKIIEERRSLPNVGWYLKEICDANPQMKFAQGPSNFVTGSDPSQFSN